MTESEVPTGNDPWSAAMRTFMAAVDAIDISAVDDITQHPAYLDLMAFAAEIRKAVPPLAPTPEILSRIQATFNPEAPPADTALWLPGQP